MIIYKKGDLLKADVDLIAHGCNCRGGFGSGIAQQIALRFPKAKFYYLDKHETEGWNLGEVQYVPTYKFVIANCATQDAYLPRGVQHADYDAIRTAMKRVKAFADTHNYSVAIPKIGAGLAGGNWNIIEKIINEVFADKTVFCYTLDQ